MWDEKPPTDRDRAIETLVDMEPFGPYYRAARMLEEAVPNALMHRPNLVTRSALVEQAHSLSEFPIDDVHKYDKVYGMPDVVYTNNYNQHLRIPAAQRERILKHLFKMTSLRKGQSLKPSPQLVASLRRSLGDGEHVRTLLQEIVEHPTFASSAAESVSVGVPVEQPEQEMTAPLEALLGRVCQMEENSDDMITGLLLTSLSALAQAHNPEADPEDEELLAASTNDPKKQTQQRRGSSIPTSSNSSQSSSTRNESDPSPWAFFQVGSLLSLLMPDEDDRSSLNIEMDLLKYFGEAAAVYEERTEIQKQQILQQTEATATPTGPSVPSLNLTLPSVATSANESSTADVIATAVIPPPPAETPTASSGLEVPDVDEGEVFQINVRDDDDLDDEDDDDDDEEDSDVEDDDDEMQQDMDLAAAALSAAVFEQIIAAATGAEGSDPDDDDDASSEPSDDDEDGPDGGPNSGSSSSSSSSSSSDEEAEPPLNNEDDEDDVLRAALAMSLVENVEAALSPTGEDTDDMPSSSPQGTVTPRGSPAPISSRASDNQEARALDESPLPSLPTYPRDYPYSYSKSDDDEFADLDHESVLNPAALNRFAALPAPQVLIHLLRFLNSSLLKKKFSSSEGSGGPEKVPKIVPGGMGATVFPTDENVEDDFRAESSEDAIAGICLRVKLCVTLLVLLLEQRDEAVENLKRAIGDETFNNKEGKMFSRGRSQAAAHGSPLDEEGEDPALALALETLEEELEDDSTESLEAKGMSRKAAAKAQDEAIILKALQKKRITWKNRVSLYSHAAVLAMKSLRLYLQMVTRDYIRGENVIQLADCAKHCSGGVLVLLSKALDSLCSMENFSVSLGLTSGGEIGDVEDCFMPLAMYQQAVLLWGECIPLLYPTNTLQDHLLRALLNECCGREHDSIVRSLEKSTILPVNGVEPAYHRLQMICRRLRVSDILGGIVRRPLSFIPASDAGMAGKLSDGRSDSPLDVPKLLKHIRNSSSVLGGIKGDLLEAYLAICHRFHTKVLIWDGLLGYEANTLEGTPAMSASPNAVIRVKSIPTSAFQFDSSKCSDSIAIIPDVERATIGGTNGSSVHQRASKVWGTVISSKSYSPKSGVHRWAIRLDKCERGHVFVGVATAQAGLKTYVGGDKFGWGMIGTQALWHDRRKLRGDYGSTFRTGSVIVVSVDTDAGTLSFGSWKDSPSASSFSVDPMAQSYSPRKQAQNGGFFEDWGIAFEGLPLDSRIFPAVGLYQRDDRVTLLPVEGVGKQGLGIGGLDPGVGLRYMPVLQNQELDAGDRIGASKTRTFNDMLSWQAIEYVKETLDDVSSTIWGNGEDTNLVRRILPSMASSLCLTTPVLPTLAKRFALHVLPQVTKFMLDTQTVFDDDTAASSLFDEALTEGKWVIRATGGSSVESAEEYVVDLSTSLSDIGLPARFSGSGIGTTGKSKNGLVSIFGTVQGSLLHFVEEWRDGVRDGIATPRPDDTASSCVVLARLSVCGRKFEGTYKNVQYGTTGQICGSLSEESRMTARMRHSDISTTMTPVHAPLKWLLASQTLLGLAHTSLGTILTNESVSDFGTNPALPSVENTGSARQKTIDAALSSPFFSMLCVGSNESVDSEIEVLREAYDHGQSSDVGGSILDSLTGLPMGIMKAASEANREQILELVEKWDQNSTISSHRSSYCQISPVAYNEAKSAVISAFLIHCDPHGASLSNRKESVDFAAEVWAVAVASLDAKIRSAMSARPPGATITDVCESVCHVSSRAADFLFETRSRVSENFAREKVVKELRSFFELVETVDDIQYIQQSFRRVSIHGLLRCFQMRETVRLMSGLLSATLPCPAVIESVLSGVPRLLLRGRYGIARAEKSIQRGPRGHPVLGSFYSPALTGCKITILDMLDGYTSDLYCSCSAAIRRTMTTETHGNDYLAHSLRMTLLSVLTCPVKPECFVELLHKSGLLEALHLSLSRSRYSGEEFSGSLAEPSVERSIGVLGRREMLRNVSRIASACLHSVFYQLLVISEQPGSSSCIQAALRLLCEELSYLHNEELEFESKRRHLSLKRVDSTTWSHICAKVSSQDEFSTPKAKSKVLSAGQMGVHFLDEYGMLAVGRAHTPGSQRSSTKAVVDGAPFAPLGVMSHGRYIKQLLTQRVHMVVAVARDRAWLSEMSTHSEWLDLLLRICGVSQGDPNGILVPAYFRSRMLRVLAPILTRTEPSIDFAASLLRVAGQNSPLAIGTSDTDSALVARSAVSLLRSLHSPEEFEWRKCVTTAIVSSLTKSYVSAEFVGSLLFLNGMPEAVAPGSFVLLKPVASLHIASENQGGPGGKGSSNTNLSSSVPLHTQGNGTEAVVAGLCRREAQAGIVSNVDINAGSCEVVLLSESRESLYTLKPDDTVDLVDRPPSLTIRALRTQLSDIAQAAEIPLVLDETIGSGEMLFKMLMTLMEDQIDATTNSANKEWNGIWATGALSIVCLRALIVLLSDPRICRAFTDAIPDRSLLQRLLIIACQQKPTEPMSSSSLNEIRLSSLPVQEAKLVHLMLSRRELRLWSSARRLVEDSTWKARQAEFLEAIVSVKSASPEILNDPSDTPSASLARSNKTDEVQGSESVARRVGLDSSRRATSASQRENTAVDDTDDEAAATAVAHLREAAIAQMAELGLPRSWSELALRRTGGINIEAAVHFCLERGADMERLLAEERDRDQILQRQSGSGRRRVQREEHDSSTLFLRQLQEMGFPRRWCSEALAATGNNVDEALTWILTNGERLSAEDEGTSEDADFEDDDDDSQDDGDKDDASSSRSDTKNVVSIGAMQDTPDEQCDTPGWSGTISPVRFISGKSIVDPMSLEVSGLPTGGFSSVGTKGILLTSGKWYYEAILETAGCLQIGWADGSFAGHCHADRGDGCGDGPSSWAYDGWRRYRWHSTATEWGCRWKEGDIVGCMVDMDEKTVSFTLNGRGSEVGMGLAFSGDGFRPVGGVYACVSFNRKEKLRLVLGGEGNKKFHYKPDGFRGVGEAVLDAVRERDRIIKLEEVLNLSDVALPDSTKEDGRFLCDFSDGEHGHELMAWAHRYYGSDASVHLGAGRPKSSTDGTKTSSSSTCQTCKPSGYVNFEIENEILSMDRSKFSMDSFDLVEMLNAIDRGVAKKIDTSLQEAGKVLQTLYTRKLVLHLMLTLQGDFNPSLFVGESDDGRLLNMLWHIVESSASLGALGWVGEAGAMALAAESLGLGISSGEHVRSRSTTAGKSVSRHARSETGGFLFSCGGFTQVLSTIGVHKAAQDTGKSVAAASETAMGSDSGVGTLVFLVDGIRSALYKNPNLRGIAVASTRRSVRLLSVVEYSSNDVIDGDEDDNFGSSKDTDIPSSEQKHEGSLVDARVVTYFTGVLLGLDLPKSSQQDLRIDLFEAWSIGLLSASLPWRMICAFTCAGILTLEPTCLGVVIKKSRTLHSVFCRLRQVLARRIWAERAASPIFSKYAQSLLELCTSIEAALKQGNIDDDFVHRWRQLDVDAATPMKLPSSEPASPREIWESEEGWVSCDESWEVLTGYVDLKEVDWKSPSRSAVRSLMDGGDGPPMLREGCTVMRGLDWDSNEATSNEDGKDIYEEEKATKETKTRDTQTSSNETSNESEQKVNLDPAEDPADEAKVEGDVNPAEESETKRMGQSETSVQNEDCDEMPSNSTKDPRSKKKKTPHPKLPIGTVVAIEPWKGMEGLARRVRWHLTGLEGVYRYGGDGGCFDISHVEVNSKETRVRKRHPLPESAEQCAARHGFGSRKRYGLILRIRRTFSKSSANCFTGILEWPDFGAGILVSGEHHVDGSISLVEERLLFGSKDSGWEARFGRASFVAGTKVVLRVDNSTRQPDLDTRSPYASLYEELVGNATFEVEALRCRQDGKKIQVESETHIYRPRRSSDSLLKTSLAPPPLAFDQELHAPSITLSRDSRTASCTTSEGRGTVFASLGFTKGVHYWEVKIEQADVGSIFIGVAEKPSVASGSSQSFSRDSHPRLNRWHGWGFVNFRATYTSGAERVYGAHCHAGDTIGVLLDCDAGRVSFFFDGLKYGEHILNDLGCAFENLSPFGFNMDGCGSGGAGQGAPSATESSRSGRYLAQGMVRPKALFPVVGLRNQGDRVTLSAKWSTTYGIDGHVLVDNALKASEIVQALSVSRDIETSTTHPSLPAWFVDEAFFEYRSWLKARRCRTTTRGSGPYQMTSYGLEIDLDTSHLACAEASALIGLPYALLAGDRVRLRRSAGRILELAEEALVLGAYQGRLYYRIVSQKSEGGSLTEGGGRAWYWDESEVVDEMPFLSPPRGLKVPLPRMARFRCCSRGGLKISYEGGAIMRSDLEIFDGSVNIGSIPHGVTIPQEDVIERRVNSCGIVRYLVRFEPVGEGWISSRIRGGKEEPIVVPVDSESSTVEFATAYDSAFHWHKNFLVESEKGSVGNDAVIDTFDIPTKEDFVRLMRRGIFPGLNILQSDALLSRMLCIIGEHSDLGGALNSSFVETLSALRVALMIRMGKVAPSVNVNQRMLQLVASQLASLDGPMPQLDSIMARAAVLRALNRRVKFALPALPLVPCQEGSGILGGACGRGSSIYRSGRSSETQSSDWIQLPSVASGIRSCREVIFATVKHDFIRSLTEVTSTPTPMSHDEYELPREIRTVRINRLKARRALAASDKYSIRKHSVFTQLQNETKNWSGASLRRSFVAKGHGGQKRAFKVKLIGEGVNDYSGPYREVFSDALSEVLQSDSQASGFLGVLDPTPNNAAGVGENQGSFMFSFNSRTGRPSVQDDGSLSQTENVLRSAFAALMIPRDESSREVEESLLFLGRLVATAFRHGIAVDLPLPATTVWKALAEQDTCAEDMAQEIDTMAFRLGDTKSVNDLYLWQRRMLNAFVEGLSHVIPVEVLPLFTAAELQDLICGSSEVDVDLLRRVVEYEGYEEDDQVIQFFWEALREFTEDERKLFLQFVWARNRLPKKESDFDAPFKIQKDSDTNKDVKLPSASTCFFSLSLPEYSSKDVLKEKLLFAVNNVATMETDFQTNSAEIAEGYRAL